MSDFDVVIIGAGPGGYVCAIRAAQLGLSVACVESNDTLGGTCLNVGCIPSKALLHASEAYHASKTHFSKMGIYTQGVNVNWDKMQEYKESMISQNTQGIKFLFKKNGIKHFQGWAKILDENTISVGDKKLSTKHMVIATGSAPTEIKFLQLSQTICFPPVNGCDQQQVADESTEAATALLVP